MLRSVWTQLWITLVVATVLLAFYTSLGRQLIPLIETQKSELESLLQQQLGLPVSVGTLEGDWNLLSPVVRLVDIQVGTDDEHLSVGRIEAELDISASAFYFSPVFKRILVENVRAPLSQKEDGQLFLGEQPLINTANITDPKTDKADKKATPRWLEWLGYQQAVILSDWEITNARSSGSETLLIRKVLWRNRGQQHALEGDVAWGREEIADVYIGAQLKGPLWPWDDQEGQIYLRADEQQWTRWIPEDLPRELSLPSLRGSMEGWLSIADGDLDSIYVRGEVPELMLDAPAKQLVLTDGHLEISGERSDEDWHLSIRQEFTQNLPLNELRLSSVQLDEERAWHIGIPRADLQDVSNFILDYNLLPERFSRYITNLEPEGLAESVRISLVPEVADTGERGVDIRADLSDVSTKAFIGIPAFTGADGHLHLQPQGGVAHIDDPSMSMHLDGVYNPTWQLTDASASFYWDIQPELFNLRLIGLDAGLRDARVHGDLAIRLPRRDTDVESHLALILGIDKADIRLQEDLVPDMLDPSINAWLDDSLRGGTASQVGFVLNGVIGGDIPENGLTTQLYLEADNATIDYLDGWPSVAGVKGRVFLDSPDLDAWIEEGRTLGGQLSPGARVKLRDTRAGTELSVSGHIEGDSSEALLYLQETPLADLIDRSLDDWLATGTAATDLSLNMILGDEDATPDVELRSVLQNTGITLTSADLAFSEVNGALTFDTDTGLFADKLSGRIFGGEFILDINSVATGDSYRIDGDASGSAEWQSFKQWADLFLLDPVKGQLNYRASLGIDPAEDNPFNLLIESDLQGTGISLPAPMGKTPEDKRRLTALVTPGETIDVSVNYDDLLSTSVRLNDAGVSTGEVVLGGGEARIDDSPGIDISGRIPGTVNVSDWWDVWDRMMLLVDRADERAKAQGLPTELPENTLGNTNPVSSVELTIDALDAWDIPIGVTRVSGGQEFGEWTIQLANEVARGTVVIREDDSEPLVLLMDFVHVPEPQESAPEQQETLASSDAGKNIESTSQNMPQAVDPMAEFIPADVSAMDITIQELYYGTRNFGRWQATTRPIPSGLSLQVLDSDMKGIKLQGTLDWVLREGQHATRMTEFDVSASKVADIQRAFRLQPVVEGDRLTGKFSLDWIGSPAGFDTETLNGKANFRITDGRVNAEGAAALKAFGALNFNSIFRRLRLDFSDLVGSGLAFDTMKGAASIEQGVLTLSEPITVDGPGGKFLTSGMTNLNTTELDMKLAVTFPVTNTLPLVAVLAGFAPPVAASIYVTERLIGDELERFTSASYTISGTWEEPDVKLNKAFDNDVEGKKSRGFMDRVLSIFGLGGDD